MTKERLTVEKLIQDFLEHLEVEKGRSKKTTDNYGRYLERFEEIASEIKAEDGREGDLVPEDITPELLRKFRLKLNRYTNLVRDEGLSVLTQSYHLIALRGFLKYLARREIKSLDPSLVDLPKAIKKQVTFLHYDEVEEMINAIPEETESDFRDRAILELLFSGGLRVSELVGLNRDSINLERREFIVRGKGSKDPDFYFESGGGESSGLSFNKT